MAGLASRVVARPLAQDRKEGVEVRVDHLCGGARGGIRGWIDGQKGKLDDAWWLQRFTPRGAKSIWSKVNREKAVTLIETGNMKPPGLAEVERAKRDGRWEAAYDSQSRATVPPDLAKALAANPRAAGFFETVESYNRYAVLFRIHTAKKPETRAARIEKFVAMLARHETLHPPKTRR
jgi:uncharacterized protein YdeI (YjbR/CyaY-like superfamily)